MEEKKEKGLTWRPSILRDASRSLALPSLATQLVSLCSSPCATIRTKWASLEGRSRIGGQIQAETAQRWRIRSANAKARSVLSSIDSTPKLRCESIARPVETRFTHDPIQIICLLSLWLLFFPFIFLSFFWKKENILDYESTIIVHLSSEIFWNNFFLKDNSNSWSRFLRCNMRNLSSAIIASKRRMLDDRFLFFWRLIVVTCDASLSICSNFALFKTSPRNYLCQCTSSCFTDDTEELARHLSNYSYALERPNFTSLD